MPYYLKEGYVSREQPQYFVDDPRATTGVVWQPDVYAAAEELAKRVGATLIVDVGCGNGQKLIPLAARYEIIGIDYGANIEACRSAHPAARWIEHDLETGGPLPLSEAVLRRSVLVCSDVIEHLVRPDRLLDTLAEAHRHALGLILSTPERDLTRGRAHMGPPPNRHHVREWSLEELTTLLEQHGFTTGSVTLTRTNDRWNERHTILATLLPQNRDQKAPPGLRVDRKQKEHLMRWSLARVTVRRARALLAMVTGRPRWGTPG